MEYKVLVDSCGELTEEMKESGIFTSVPLSILVENYHIVDDESFNQGEFIKIAKESKECPRSACPSPEQYMDLFKGEEKRVYVVTLSSNLSGSYNSANLAKQMYEEEDGEKEIHIFDSNSASVGETLIALKIRECEERGLDFAALVEAVESYIEEQHTYFVLEDLDTLRKNGRLTGIKLLVASALNIKPILGSTPEGTIQQLGQGRGINKALQGMVKKIIPEIKNSSSKILAISHCNCKERALQVKEMILKLTKVKEVIILDTRGISTMYASNGGIIVVI
ncbi:DegV family protein with EDD domain [Aequitasia blattaphilus]|uniref:DegV family protein n=1 Tax=Aequitasia blattaphilus TaxID=2949332 RepID=A0ABT1E671_9FIRM|nr:DegV family protein [Aequitasia blattaphilus]MCP1101344.1 DegV family protein [Aequitasia blattaphilus]MCR8613984.1 DegV family protein [Aequitasia blattaphilus]